MRRSGEFVRAYWLEVAVVLLAILAAVEVTVRRDSTNAPESSLWVTIPAAAAIVLPIALRRRWPFAAGAGVWFVAVAASFVDGRLVVFSASVYAAGILAAFLLGNLNDRLQSRVGLVLIVGGTATLVYNDPTNSGGAFFFVPALFAMIWLGGLALQQRGARAEAAELRAARLAGEREEATRAAIADERARISRELHDVVGHAVSVMTIQASAVRRVLLEGQKREREALLSVEQTGREALAEMRRLVGSLRLTEEGPDFEPQPGVEQIPGLVSRAEREGTKVWLTVDGDAAPLPPGVDLTAYRIVQEGLTNARKHSNAQHIDVRLRYGTDCIEVEVRDDGLGNAPDGDGGLGLVGLRERVSIYGGELQAGPRPGGGYRLWARLPVPS